jgi:hypothetical protein
VRQMAFVWMAGVGCASYSSVDEACHPKDQVRGQRWLTQTSYEGVRRLDCHRRTLGFARMPVNRRVQLAVDASVDYVLANSDVLLTGGVGAFLMQDGQREGFTGTTVFDRLDAQGYIYERNSMWIHEILSIHWEEDGRGATFADALVRDHQLQDIALRPSVRGVGWFDRSLPESFWDPLAAVIDLPPGLDSTRLFYAVVVSDNPPTEGSGKSLITYPVDGQTGVALQSTFNAQPTPMNSDGEPEPGRWGVHTGPPILVARTMMSRVGPSQSFNNPFQFVVESATLRIDGERVPAFWINDADTSNPLDLPDVNGSWRTWSSSVVPEQPLEPDSTYELEVRWRNRDGAGVENVSFTTGDDPDGWSSGAGATESESTQRRLWLGLRAVKAWGPPADLSPN